MTLKIQITPRKSEQLHGIQARFVKCAKCQSDVFVKKGIFSTLVCAHCHLSFKRETGVIYKIIELGGEKSSRKTRPGSGARFKKSDIDFGRRK